MSDPVLTYLQGDSQGAKRDMIAQFYYEVVQGDPKSGPVAFAVLLDACAEQFAKTPKELADATTRFDWVLAEAREFERKLMDRVEKSNASVIAAFKDETARANLALQVTVLDAKATVVKAQQIQEGMNPVIATTKEIGSNVILLRDDLRKFDTSVLRVEKMAGDIHETHISALELVKLLTKEIRANWTTIGFSLGVALEYALAVSIIPNSYSIVLFVVGAGVIQGLFRWNWTFVRKLAKRILPPSKAKPAG
jgi:hypothetical protein